MWYQSLSCQPGTPYTHGSQPSRWSHKRWFAIFFFVMTAFMLMGSEGLKNVI